jgi:peptidoglycan hydrolase-like amidase
MKRYIVSAALIALSALTARLHADAPEVRVLIMDSEDRVELVAGTKADIRNGENEGRQLREEKRLEVRVENDRLVLAERRGEVLLRGASLYLENGGSGGSIRVLDVPYGNGWWWAGREDRSYQGDLEFHINAVKHIDVVNVLNIEHYLYGVLPAEIGTDAPPEALKAQTVCARSEALVGLETGKYAGAHHDLTSDVMCQVYYGIGESNKAVRAAVDATRGKVLTYKDTVISAYYASNCGGHTENIENIWPHRPAPGPYRSSHTDMEKVTGLDLRQAGDIRTWVESDPPAWCRPGPNTPEWARDNFRWRRSVGPDALSGTLSEKYRDIGRVYDIIPLERGVSGRINDILFIGDSGHIRITGELDIRRLWDSPLKSSCFVVDKIGPAGRPATFILSGAGWGHGVGMCQTGAIAMAQKGRTYRDILNRYFRGADIQQRYK